MGRRTRRAHQERDLPLLSQSRSLILGAFEHLGETKNSKIRLSRKRNLTPIKVERFIITLFSEPKPPTARAGISKKKKKKHVTEP